MTIPTGHPDAARARLRELVALVQAQIDRLTDAPPALAASFKALTVEMALGPASEVRACPHCGGIAMAEAIRCMHCWSKLVPAEKATPPAPSTD